MRSLRTITYKDLIWIADHVLAPLGEGSLALVHLVPRTAEGIVGQELHHVARGEELVAEGELIGVSRRWTIFSCHVPKFLGREVLVDPPDRLITYPDIGERCCIQLLHHRIDCPLRREEAVCRISGGEENPDLFVQRRSQPPEIMAVGFILLA